MSCMVRKTGGTNKTYNRNADFLLFFIFFFNLLEGNCKQLYIIYCGLVNLFNNGEFLEGVVWHWRREHPLESHVAL